MLKTVAKFIFREASMEGQFDQKQDLTKLEQMRQEREANITLRFEGRSQSEIWEERFAAIEARLDKLEQVGRKQ